MFYEKKLQRTYEEQIRIQKVIKKGYDSSFNSSIDKKDVVEWNSMV